MPLRRALAAIRVLDAKRPAPKHPARATTESPVGLLARGSPPVTAFPGLSQWQFGTGSPPTVAGAAAALEHSFRTAFPVRSRMRDRRSRALNGRHLRFVNAEAPRALAVDFLAAIVVRSSTPTGGTKKGTW